MFEDRKDNVAILILTESLPQNESWLDSKLYIYGAESMAHI